MCTFDISFEIHFMFVLIKKGIEFAYIWFFAD